MNTATASLFAKLEFGEPLAFANMVVIPLLVRQNGKSIDFASFNEALEAKQIVVTEISSAGTVPYLFVKNLGERPIVILEGEEIVGLKQNRILNTTVVIKEMSESKIPVSCCEAGRWSYQESQDVFSRFVAPPRLRSIKVEGVNNSLGYSNTFLSHQSAVWDTIDEIHFEARTKSPTSALQDAFRVKKIEVQEYEKSLIVRENQNGILVLINGKPVGIDLFCSNKFYSKVHNKLIQGYALEAVLEDVSIDKFDPMKIAEDFLSQVKSSNEQKHKSIAFGWDYRYENENIVGFSVVYESVAVHSVFLPKQSRHRRKKDYDLNGLVHY